MRNYRGLTKDGKWVYGWYAEEDNVSGILNNPGDGNPRLLWNEVIPETVGQQIGLPDKNDVEIYHKDIVTTGDGFKYLVEWSDLDGAWYFKGIGKNIYDLTPIDMPYQTMKIQYPNREIIGNAHQEVKI